MDQVERKSPLQAFGTKAPTSSRPALGQAGFGGPERFQKVAKKCSLIISFVRGSRKIPNNWNRLGWVKQGVGIMLILLLQNAAVAEMWTIEPGQGVGPFRFGQSRAEVVRILSAWGPMVRSEYYVGIRDKLGLVFMDEELCSISVATDTLSINGKRIVLKTQDGGLSVGDRANAFIEVYGQIFDAGGG